MDILLLLISGRSDKIIDANKLNANKTKVIKIDEKDLANFKKILNIIREKKYSAVYFGTVENKFQRFHFFMKLYILFSKTKKGGAIDEFGNKNLFSVFSFIFKEIPFFIIELILSIFYIIFYYIKFPFIKWTYLKRK